MPSNTLTDITSSIKSSLDAKLGRSDKATSASVADSVSWSNISSKPSVYTPSSHTHSWNDITNKPNIPSNPNASITESWNSGANGYRLWNNGVKEQWGQASSSSQNISITLHKPMKNNTYCCMSTQVNSGLVKYATEQIYGRTTTGFTIYSDSRTATWYVIGL